MMVWSHLESDIMECEVKWALGSINKNKGNGGDGIPVELFQILKDNAVKVLHSICQQIWKTVFISIPKKGNAKECSNYHTIALISHANKITPKILQVRIQQYVNGDLSDVQLGFRKCSNGHRTGKGQFSLQSQRRAIPKCHTIALISHISKVMLQIF